MSHPKDFKARRRQVVLAGALASTGLLTACGSDNDADPAPAPPAAPPVPPAPPVPATISSFGLVVLPDTQFYSRYASEETGNQFARRYGSTPYAAQTQWIADNAAAFRIPFVIHVGDIVDQVKKPQQWEVADKAMKILEDKAVPYSVLAGNHDVLSDVGYETDRVGGTDAGRDLAAEPYLKWFGTERARRQATFGGRDPSGFHEYHVFQAEGQRFLVLSLSWRASDAGIAWAREVLRANPTLPAILVNHQLIAIANDGVQPLEVDYGLMLWERLIRDQDQIFMTVNGHHHGAARLTKTNTFGNAVEEMVVDYQMAYQGGNGLLRFYEFDLTNNEIRALSFSPWVKGKPQATLNEFDQIMLKDANNEFTVKMDFAKRFARFRAGLQAGQRHRHVDRRGRDYADHGGIHRQTGGRLAPGRQCRRLSEGIEHGGALALHGRCRRHGRSRPGRDRRRDRQRQRADARGARCAGRQYGAAGGSAVERRAPPPVVRARQHRLPQRGWQAAQLLPDRCGGSDEPGNLQHRLYGGSVRQAG